MDLERPNAELLLRAYARGIFPMVDPASGTINYYSPDPRAVIPLDAFHVPRSLAHSVEAWRDGALVGGLYGVHVGAAFFGESMFSRPEAGGRDSSKLCL